VPSLLSEDVSHHAVRFWHPQRHQCALVHIWLNRWRNSNDTFFSWNITGDEQITIAHMSCFTQDFTIICHLHNMVEHLTVGEVSYNRHKHLPCCKRAEHPLYPCITVRTAGQRFLPLHITNVQKHAAAFLSWTSHDSFDVRLNVLVSCSLKRTVHALLSPCTYISCSDNV